MLLHGERWGEMRVSTHNAATNTECTRLLPTVRQVVGPCGHARCVVGARFDGGGISLTDRPAAPKACEAPDDGYPSVVRPGAIPRDVERRRHQSGDEEGGSIEGEKTAAKRFPFSLMKFIRANSPFPTPQTSC